MSSEAIFLMTFELNIEMKHNDTTGVTKVTSVGHLLSPTSFPILSTNASDCSANIKFLSTCEKLSNVYSGGYRTRNRFIVARTTFATIISKGRHIENKDVSRVSSTLWKKSSFTLRDYFEYLAKLEKTWWESSRRKKEYKSVNTAFDKLFIPYTILCSSSYGLVSFARTKPAPFSVIKLDSNFKIKKKKAAKSKIKVLPSYELGLATEDVFL